MKCLKCLQLLDPPNAHYGLHNECFMAWFNVSNKANFISLTQRSSHSSDPHIKSNSENTSFFHGKFKKYSAELDGVSYILKMREIEAPELPEVEYLCNQIGKELEIPLAEFFMIDFEGSNVFVTKNFIKKNVPTDLQHIYHFTENADHSCGNLIRIVAEKTNQVHDVIILIKTILFDALIGNHDRHGRNLAFITTSTNTSLSPIYDNVSYLGLEKDNMLKADFNPTGKISTFATIEPSMYDYVKELKRLGYQDYINEFYSKINLKKLNHIIQESFCSQLMKEAVAKLVQKRYLELKHELND